MNYEQIKRLSIEEPKDMKMFIECFDAEQQAIIDDGPANFAASWIEALYSGDEELSFKVWMLTLAKIKNYFLESSKAVEIRDFKRMSAYIALLKSVFKDSDINTIPFMHNTRKWQSMLFIELDTTRRMGYYAINKFLIEKLTTTGVQLMGFEAFLENEPTHVIIGSEAYYKFIKEVLKKDSK